MEQVPTLGTNSLCGVCHSISIVVLNHLVKVQGGHGLSVLRLMEFPCLLSGMLDVLAGGSALAASGVPLSPAQCGLSTATAGSTHPGLSRRPSRSTRMLLHSYQLLQHCQRPLQTSLLPGAPPRRQFPSDALAVDVGWPHADSRIRCSSLESSMSDTWPRPRGPLPVHFKAALWSSGPYTNVHRKPVGIRWSPGRCHCSWALSGSRSASFARVWSWSSRYQLGPHTCVRGGWPVACSMM
jgi:hypothetical protein